MPHKIEPPIKYGPGQNPASRLGTKMTMTPGEVETTLATMAAQTPPGGMLPNETAKAYAAFQVYRDMDPRERSILKVPAAFYGQDGPDAPDNSRIIERWAAKYKWTARAHEWDREQAAIKLSKHLDAIGTMAERHAAQGQALLTALMQPSLELLRRLQRNPETFREQLGRYDAGDIIKMIAMTAPFVQAAVNIERLARGMTTENIQVNQKGVDNPFGDRLTNDPDTARLASDLFRRLTGMGEGDADGAGVPGEQPALDSGGPPDAAE